MDTFSGTTIRLATPVDRLVRLPPGAKDALAALGIQTASDVLWHIPMRYDTMGGVTGGVLQPGPCTVDALVVKVGTRKSFRSHRTFVEAVLEVSGRKIPAIWFNQPYVTKKIFPGSSYRFTGTASRTRGVMQLVNPYIESLGNVAVVGPSTSSEQPLYGSEVMPVYALTEGVGQHTMRRLARASLASLANLADPLPAETVGTMALMALPDALHTVHAPTTLTDTEKARTRLAFDEVLAVQLALTLTKSLRLHKTAPTVPFNEPAVKTLVASLPFTLTTDQRKAAWDIIKDMEKGRPMQRLLNGDVGSGKTAVAAIAAVNAAYAGFQSAFMAPTEILASQHFKNLAAIYAKNPFKISIWTNSMKGYAESGKITWCISGTERAALATEIADGGIHILFGTHALIQEGMQFARLALVVVDEQHRFGVRARQALLGKGANGTVPHLLSMTATPIPRSLALVAYGDVDVSLLKEKPKDRKPIITKMVTGQKKTNAYAFVRQELEKGRQAFVVCPLIDPAEDTLGITSVTEECERLKKGEFKNYRLGMLHGKMAAREKAEIMEKMQQKKIDLLVATSVVEVGVDVPNATVMWIEGAERFGIAQLHQFRGRVGRGEQQSYCFLVPTQLPQTAKVRLKTLEESNDGFVLAERDLATRGQGEILGDAQSGFGQFRIASLADIDLIAKAKECAEHLLTEDPDLSRHPLLKQQLSRAIEQAHWE